MNQVITNLRKEEHVDIVHCTLYPSDLLSPHVQGKYMEIQFSRGGQPDGGKISNFLLEKVNMQRSSSYCI